MNPKIKKIIIIIIVAILSVVLYGYFSKKSDTPTTTSSLVSQSGTQALGASSTNQEINKDTAFLTTLLSLGKTTIDPAIFSDNSFKSLQDNTVEILNNELTGRPNPFIPFDTSIPKDTTTILPEILPTEETGNSTLFLPDFSTTVPSTTTTGNKKK